MSLADALRRTSLAPEHLRISSQPEPLSNKALRLARKAGGVHPEPYIDNMGPFWHIMGPLSHILGPVRVIF